MWWLLACPKTVTPTPIVLDETCVQSCLASRQMEARPIEDIQMSCEQSCTSTEISSISDAAIGQRVIAKGVLIQIGDRYGLKLLDETLWLPSASTVRVGTMTRVAGTLEKCALGTCLAEISP